MVYGQVFRLICNRLHDFMVNSRASLFGFDRVFPSKEMP